MCIVLTDAKPSQTHIVLLPVQVDGKDWSCMLYTNTLRVQTGTPGLMIVAIPNPTLAKRFGLFDVALAKALRGDLNECFRKYQHRMLIKTNGYSKELLGFELEGYDMAPVHDIGNYRISVAVNHAALMSSIDWSKFTLPLDFGQRLVALSDPCVVPPHAAFVVAEALKSVKDDGFAVLFPGRATWFPTCHESQAAGTEYEYDALLYAGNATAPESMWSDHKQSTLWSLTSQHLTTEPLTLYVGAMPSAAYVRLNTATLPTRVRASDSMRDIDTLDVVWPPLRSVTFTHLRGKSLRNFNVGEQQLTAAAAVTAAAAATAAGGGVGAALSAAAAPFTADEFTALRARGSLFARGAMHYAPKLNVTVRCDVCRANITDEPCFGHNTFDVCMACLMREEVAATATAAVATADLPLPFTQPAWM